ncbi:MAG: hypothetical protein MJZ38_04260 [archaeon]|nr:hypothetical protein [archaeon]
MYGRSRTLILVTSIAVLMVFCCSVLSVADVPGLFSELVDTTVFFDPTIYLLVAVLVSALVVISVRRYVVRLESGGAARGETYLGDYCPECGAHLLAGEDFCHCCGNPLKIRLHSPMNEIERMHRSQ